MLAHVLVTLAGQAFGLRPVLRRCAPRPPPRAAAAADGVVPVADFSGASTGSEDSLKVAKSGDTSFTASGYEQANMRLGTAMAKTRAEVCGGGRGLTSRRAPAVLAVAPRARRCSWAVARALALVRSRTTST